MNQFFDPQQQQEAIRRRKLGEQLMAVGKQQPTQVVSGLAVPQSAAEQLARGLAAGIGSYQNARANALEDEYRVKSQQGLAEALKQYGNDPKALAGVLLQSPEYANAGLDIYTGSMEADRQAAAEEAKYNRTRADALADFERKAALNKELRAMELERDEQKYQRNKQDRIELAGIKSGANIIQDGEIVPNPEPQKPSLSKGQEAVDKAFAKEYVALQSVGGLADIDKRVGQLQEAAASLQSGKNITGAWTGLVPEFAEPALIPSTVETREAVEEVVQRNLREVLGAQFTQREGDRLIARAFNPKLSEEENAKRVGRLIKQIESALRSKRSAIEYFEENGTLVGWSGKLPSIGDLEAAVDGSSYQGVTPQASSALDAARQAIQAGRDPEMVKQRLRENGIDPAGL